MKMKDSIATTRKMVSFDVSAKELVENNIVALEKHKVDRYHIMVPKSDAIDSIGALNRHNPIKITDEHSLLFYDIVQKNLVDISVSEALEDPYRYFTIIGAPPRDLNTHAIVDDNTKVELDYITGFMLVVYFKLKINEPIIINQETCDYLTSNNTKWRNWFDASFTPYTTYKNSTSHLIEMRINRIYGDTDFKLLADSVIIDKRNYYSIANEIVFSSNTDFVIGMLEGFMMTEKIMTHNIGEFLVYRSMSVNICTNILTYLFSDFRLIKAYQRRYPGDYMFTVDFTVSPLVFDRLVLSRHKVKIHKWTWKIWGDGDVRIDRWKRSAYESATEDTPTLIKQLIDLKEQDKIKFIRTDEYFITQIRCQEPEYLYDLTMGNGDATNYLLYGGPFSKNSDGDLIALFGIMSEEGLKSAKQLSVLNKNRLKNSLNPDEYDSWIQKDAVLGLYYGTK